MSQVSRVLIYIGTYTHGESRGIYVGELDLTSGSIALTGGTARAEHPSFLALDARRRRLYAVSEVSEFGGQPCGGVSAFALDANTGHPTLLNSRPSGGAGPCHLQVSASGRFVLVANYGGGSVAMLPLAPDGSLLEASDVVVHEGASIHSTRQRRSHPHFITMDPSQHYALATDLGTDTIWIYEPENTGQRPALRIRASMAVRAGAGPRHLDFHPSGRCVYVVNELDSTLTSWQYDGFQSNLAQMQTLSTLPQGFIGPNSCADIHVHPSGLFLYASNRGHDSIACFTLDSQTGRAALQDVVPAGGQTPRGFAIDPSGAYLVAAHQDTHTISAFAIEPLTGRLTSAGSIVSVPSPVCVKMMEFPG